VAVTAAEEELVVAGGRAVRLHLADGAQPGVRRAGAEVGLDLGEGSQRVVLTREDQDPVGVVARRRLSQAGDDQPQVRPATPPRLDAVLDRLATGGLDLLALEPLPARIVSHEHARRRPLAQGADQPHHLLRVAVGDDDVNDRHGTG
jgi:hypothetical protein